MSARMLERREENLGRERLVEPATPCILLGSQWSNLRSAMALYRAPKTARSHTDLRHLDMEMRDSMASLILKRIRSICALRSHFTASAMR